MAVNPRCFFCGRTEEVGVLVQGKDGAICEQCILLAGNLIADRRAGLIDAQGALEIGRYRPNTDLATLIGEPKLIDHLFVPLDADPHRVVIAAASLSSLDEIERLVGDALEQLGPPHVGKPIAIVIASHDAIRVKIAEACCKTS
jgi:hypothetical protein